MKFCKNQFAQATYRLAVRRALMSHIAQHCSIRKCHRDRACTGPLVKIDAEDAYLVSEDDARAFAPNLLILPLCVLHFGEKVDIRKFYAACDDIAAADAREGQASIRIKDKAVRANWKSSVDQLTDRRKCDRKDRPDVTPPASSPAPGSA